MPFPSIIVSYKEKKINQFMPTTVRKLGQNEEFLEDLIATHPELLELENDGSGNRGPFVVCRQSDLLNAFDRTVIPDLVIFSPSGHISIIEVKLNDNPELRDRRVLTQIVDYAGSFADQSADDLLNTFSMLAPGADTWETLIGELFPEENHIDLLADQIHQRLQRGEINCVIACDKAPPGTTKFLSAISQQSAIPFTVSLAEITPYVSDNNGHDQIIFVPGVLMRTEIISRTAVTVQYDQVTGNRPSVKVETTSMDEIEQNLKQINDSRMWTDEEISEAIQDSSEPIVKKLFDLVVNESNVEQFHSLGKKKNPNFGFYIKFIDEEGLEHRRQVFNYGVGTPNLRIYLNMVESMVSADRYNLFVDQLKSLFPKWMKRDLREPWFPLKDIEENFDGFREIIVSLVD